MRPKQKKPPRKEKKQWGETHTRYITAQKQQKDLQARWDLEETRVKVKSKVQPLKKRQHKQPVSAKK